MQRPTRINVANFPTGVINGRQAEAPARRFRGFHAARFLLRNEKTSPGPNQLCRWMLRLDASSIRLPRPDASHIAVRFRTEPSITTVRATDRPTARQPQEVDWPYWLSHYSECAGAVIGEWLQACGRDWHAF